MAKRILAVGHDAYRAGAQIVFLHILRWMRANHDSELSLVLNADGELLSEYEDVLPTVALSPLRPASGSPTRRTLLRARAGRAAARSNPLDALGLARGSVDLIYANSAASAPLAASLAAELRCPAVLHIHELDMSIRRSPGANAFREATRVLDHYIAVSGAVQQNLVTRFDIDAARIDIIHECIPISTEAPPLQDRTRRRAELSIPEDAFVVGGCGTVDWRKAPEVFLLVAKAVASRQPRRPIHFIWVGGEPRELPAVEHDLERLGLRATVQFVGATPEPAQYFALFDAFLLTSREDPFPLVCLEAAATGAPIVCFAGAGGMPEFVEDDAGFVVPYLDVESAADRLRRLADSEPTRTALGQRAKAKVTERNDVDVVGPRIVAVLDRFLQ